MNNAVFKTLTSKRSSWLLLLAGVLLWGQILSVEHIHLDAQSAGHECVSCQQLSAGDLAPSQQAGVLSLAAPLVEWSEPSAGQLQHLSFYRAIRAPPIA